MKVYSNLRVGRVAPSQLTLFSYVRPISVGNPAAVLASVGCDAAGISSSEQEYELAALDRRIAITRRTTAVISATHPITMPAIAPAVSAVAVPRDASLVDDDGDDSDGDDVKGTEVGGIDAESKNKELREADSRAELWGDSETEARVSADNRGERARVTGKML
jgi:hypothetical protein